MSVTITWDGSVTTPNYNEYYCRVSERIFTRAELLGGTVVFGGETYTITEDAIVNQGGANSDVDTGSYSIMLNSSVIMVTGVAGDYGTMLGSGFTLPADGTYFTRQYDTDGDYTASLYLPNAIPVNPAPTLDPTALLMGWQVGNRIRQRGGA